MPTTTAGGYARAISWTLAAVLLALAVLVGPGAGPAAACSCMSMTDREAFDMASAVFVGEVIDYQAPPNPTSSLDEAVWTFGVSEVFKGEVTRIQQLVSAVSGASCGLEIEPQGEYLVFASDSGDPDVRYTSGLCTGTRSMDAGAPDLAVAPTAPLPPAATGDPPTSTGTGTGSDADAGGTSGAGWAVAGAALVVAGAVGFRTLRSRRLTDPVDRR
jgi:hypothetical protein